MRVAKKPKKTAFVPRSLFLSVLATTSVVPLIACGGAVAGGGTGSKDSGVDTGQINGVGGVAFQGFDGSVATVAVRAFDGAFGVAQRAFDSGMDAPFLNPVAACCFDATFGVATDAFAGVADVAFVADAAFGVAQMAFDASHDAPLGVASNGFDGGK